MGILQMAVTCVFAGAFGGAGFLIAAIVTARIEEWWDEKRALRRIRRGG